ncbi:bifunctional 3-(3-hydroxy-phenyl)propionate/3-hydroxycinnamic acid hydroxylase [Actinocorallia sp. A-T 12471]|uniref:bifunctional 3-(3-hydroxy-phenyl)propionate/3-hydroxycinnamic acid hydroxylase n=1 Tax=Actinocorallia sp. A-T 12471 TaxID=3089813 RepID=UPI0029D048F4|nr:bifunctional 3-(3-hydroxy-phenyl)propionate/3-hydroxycinnamic acid hydroxylase [Actinocorallia sp. A-T 12471]MDX6741650.1 bifunctional 3-(3-hydroxy-phenyl)propionate/3-hydroxycinnamic acid hydroxylase [Actinocorallia sp. A-T 12471]
MSAEAAYDVAVIGYGPTGVTAANLLGALGLRVAVIERDTEIFGRARAISTDEEVLRVWQRIGLAELLKRDMLGDLPIEFVDAKGEPFLSAHPVSRGHGHPSQMFIYQPALEQVLRDGVARYPNVELLLERECLRVVQDADGVELTTVKTGDDTVERLRARYVIAADGGSSLTRAQLNIGYEGRTFEDRWVVIDTEMIEPWPGHDRLRFHCDPARPAVDCPTPLGHHRWEFPILPGEDETELVSDAAIARLLSRYGITEKNVKILRATVYSHHVRFAARFRVGRVFLAGDAAHAMPPWIGQGMAAGVRDAANLCWKLSAVLRGELPESVLDSYETERKPHVKGVTRRAVLVGRTITERRTAVTRVRDPLGRAISRFPALTRLTQGALWIPAAHYPAGFLAGRRTGATGWMLPQPVVLDGSGAKKRLDDALGSGWLVLHARTATPQDAWTRLGVRSVTVLPSGSAAAENAVVDETGVLLAWLDRRGTASAVLRPDGYVYAAAAKGAPLPAPPAGFRPAGQ